MKVAITLFAICVSMLAFCASRDRFAELMSKAKGGDAEAMCEVGRCYREGLGVEKDVLKASEWTRKAADGGSLLAKGQCYEFGYGVEKDEKEAVKWRQKADAKRRSSAVKSESHIVDTGFYIDGGVLQNYNGHSSVVILLPEQFLSAAND